MVHSYEQLFKKKKKYTKLVDPHWIINNHKKGFFKKLKSYKKPQGFAVLPTEPTIFIPTALCPVTLVTNSTVICIVVTHVFPLKTNAFLPKLSTVIFSNEE